MANLTPGKVKFVEEQANNMLDFVMESRAMLTKEAHTTLNWLLSVVVAGSGYIISLANEAEPRLWLFPALSVVVVACACQAVRIINQALRSCDVPPKGNLPAHLLTDELMQHQEHEVRAAEVAQLQERIETALAYNAKVGDVVNAARYNLSALPVLASAVGIVGYFIWGR